MSPALKVFRRGVDVMLSGGLGSAKLIAELNESKSIFQTKLSYDFYPRSKLG